ncbi:MAG: hypothetical protein J6T56_03770 [Bacteroidales bacterium]|nr:hypothetical protein [Bacteroidales bacterium]MBP5612535.1 hypothetical protein [Bacteroidales bacterium]
MRKTVITLLLLLCVTLLNAQKHWVFKGSIADLGQGQPLENVCIHNLSTGSATFSNGKGEFAILIKGNDTLLFTHVGYEMKNLIISDTLRQEKNRYKINMVMKSILLKGTTVYALKPYPIFLEDVAKTANAVEDGITLTKNQKADATASTSTYLYQGHPVSFLYETFSRRAKMDRLHAYLVNHEDEVRRLTAKYNPEIVSRLSGLEGADLEDFMCYCSFSYYTLIKANDDEIANMIIGRLKEYRKRNGQ